MDDINKQSDKAFQTRETAASKEAEKWYVLRAIFKKEIEVRDELQEQGIECFVPMHYVIQERKGRKVRSLVPAIRDLVFVRSTQAALKAYKDNAKNIVYFMTAKDGDGRKIIVVPPKDMDEFIRIAEQIEEDILYFRPEEVALDKGTHVRVHGGKFDGIEGTLLKVKGKRSRRVVVSITGVAAIAAAYIEPDLIEVLKF